MPSPQLWHLLLWQHWIIASFWLAQMSILIVPIMELLLGLMLRKVVPETQRWLHRYTTFGLSSVSISFALQIVELYLYRRAKLLPLIYLGSQIFKSTAPTWSLYRYMHFKHNRADIIKETVYILTFWGGLAYAIHVFILGLRRRRRYLRMAVTEQIQDLFPSEEINTAANLRATSPTLFKLVRWLNADDPWIATLPKPLQLSLKWMVFVVKYAISALPIVLLFSVSPRLPGEPFDSAMTQLLADWKYPAPYHLDPYSDLETADASQSAAGLDEESATDAVGLRSIDHLHRSERLSRHGIPQEQGSTGRLLTPRFLCFINEKEHQSSESSYSTRKVDDGLKQPASVGYVFISYTRRQFYSQISNDPSLLAADRMRFRVAAERDKATLIRFAIAAAKEAGVSAFWIDFECIRPEEDSADSSDAEEVYRICDIVRASHSMAIILGPALDEDKEHVKDSSKDDWLLGWGERLWTVPEALLCPSEHRIAVYSVGSDMPEKVAKRNLPARVWDDAGMLRQLIDHYEASLHLTQLELISIALECLHRRQTEKRNAGDVAYALMGLLRLRPTVHKTDTDFQAFARLSLANDSDMILERLVCLSKRTKTSPWHDMADTWDAKLWQIKPHFQIAGLESNNAVVIGNSSGARVDWTPLHPVAFTCAGDQHRSRWAFIRHITNYLLGWLYMYYIYQFIFVPILADIGYGKMMQDRVDWLVQVYGIAWLMLSFLTLPIPAILSQQCCRDLDTVQARFFGIEGRPRLGQVEAYIFGANCGRLKWSADRVAEESYLQGDADPRRVFTLIDTRSNTATTFRADEPPSLIFVGASEQGALRALLCSYDYTNRTFVKETVVRLESAALQSMQCLDRFRFSISPTMERSTQDTGLVSLESDRISIPDIPEFRSLGD